MLSRNIFIVLLLATLSTVQAQLRINEVMSSNTNTIVDEDNDDPDWLELYNQGTESLNITGYILSDSTNEWEVPEMIIGSKQHLLIFASGKNRREPPMSWQTIIDIGDVWHYIIPTAETSQNWFTEEFDDISWSLGKSGFGYGDGDDSTQLDNVLSVFLRKSFEIDNLSEIENVVLHMDYDDAFVAYINGTEVARDNVSSSGPPAFDQPADNYDHEAQMYQGLPPNEFPINNWAELLKEGNNIIAIQVHNHSTGSSDLTAIPFLSVSSTSGEDELSPFLTASKANLHTNFELNADGETLLLFSPDGDLVDSVTIPSLTTDISLGRLPDGTGSWRYFNEPTPGEVNTTTGFTQQSGEVNFSIPGGVFSGTQQVSLTSDKSGDKIYYTLDGALPAVSGELYDSPISVSETTSIRAQVINENALPGPIQTHTFLIQTNHDLPVVSITTDPKNLWDDEEGIYVLGNNAEPDFPFFGANFWEDWEKPVHFELIEMDGNIPLSQAVGMRIFGGWSRGNSQKSFSLHARKSYGDNTLSHRIFDNLEIEAFSSVVLRNSGNDWNNAMFRDALLTSLFHPIVDKQAYQPAVVYINGEYWGIQNIREKVNEDFLGRHHDLNPDNITILEGNAIPVEGDESEYVELINYLNSHNLSEAESYNYVADRIDIQNFIQYQIGNIFIDNKDWPGNNIKFWKSNQPGSKWRWITYDTDFGFAIWGEDPNFNTLNFALNANGPNWPNPPWSTLLLRKLIQNQQFRDLFINAFCDMLNTSWKSDQVISKIDKMSGVISSEIDDHLSRWGGDLGYWNNQVNNMKSYAEARPGNVTNHLRNRFNLGSQQSITIQANNAQGHVQLNTLKLNTFPWTGEYFESVEVVLEALPQPGYRFVRWEGSVSSAGRQIRVKPSPNTEIRAVFELSDNNLNAIVINEICYNPPNEFDTEDWVELYNKSDEVVNLTGWELKDDDDVHSFIFPDISIGSDEYLIVCRDQEIFQSFHSNSNTVGDLDFGLSGDGDCVRLFNAAGEQADEICYEVEAPWSKANQGYTLGLKQPYLDNSISSNWFLIPENGNPGASNGFPEEQLSASGGNTPFIYPNPPLEGVIYMKLDRAEEVNISLLLPDGKRLPLKSVLQMDQLVQIQIPHNLTDGVYFLSIENQNRTYLKKLLINR